MHAESLAVFADVGLKLSSESYQRTTADNELTAWLNASGADKTYWIGLVRSWWKTTDKGCLCSFVLTDNDFMLKLECWPMPNVMAAQPNIGGALCESSLIPFFAPRRKVRLTSAAGVPCSNAANIEERKTWTVDVK